MPQQRGASSPPVPSNSSLSCVPPSRTVDSLQVDANMLLLAPTNRVSGVEGPTVVFQLLTKSTGFHLLGCGACTFFIVKRIHNRSSCPTNPTMFPLHPLTKMMRSSGTNDAYVCYRINHIDILKVHCPYFLEELLMSHVDLHHTLLNQIRGNFLNMVY